MMSYIRVHAFTTPRAQHLSLKVKMPQAADYQEEPTIIPKYKVFGEELILLVL